MVTTAIEYTANTQSHIRFSPALYIAPEPCRLSSALSSSASPSTSPSPYVANQKRREWKQVQQTDSLDSTSTAATATIKRDSDLEKGDETIESDADPIDGFFDTCDTASVASSVGYATVSDFYDAGEDFLSDGSTTPHSRNIESELAPLRVSLLEEIDRRKRAEESLVNIQTKWARVASHFSTVGLSFPPIPTSQRTDELDDPIAQVCQEIVVSRLVSNALGRGLARAEAEASAEEVIQSKNREISRLHDRLQYYEAVHHEMCQRNQEAIELARQRRRWWQQAQRWVWGFVGFSVTIGGSVLAYSYLPQSTSTLDQCAISSLESLESSSD